MPPRSLGERFDERKTKPNSQKTMSNKITVIHHSADMDGIFCREIARKFLPDAELIGWDFSDKPLAIPSEGQIYILDLPVDRVFGLSFGEEGHLRWLERVIWIDHHKSSIETHNATIPGYRIDGVAACRLAWQWFVLYEAWDSREQQPPYDLPPRLEFVERRVSEPLAVRLAGEYDIWDKRDPRAEVFQFGLRSIELENHHWSALLDNTTPTQLQGTGMESTESELMVFPLLNNGHMLQRYQQLNDASMMQRSFLVDFEGVKFLALTTARCNSLTFASKDIPETGHDALMGFYWNGKWNVSLYHAKHRTDLDLSTIAVSYGGGGHKGACGFQIEKLPFIP
jgi:hypothetical protein